MELNIMAKKKTEEEPKELTEIEQAEDWAGHLTNAEKKKVFGGEEPDFNAWWPSLTSVDKLYEWNKWKDIVKGTKKKLEPVVKPEEPEEG